VYPVWSSKRRNRREEPDLFLRSEVRKQRSNPFHERKGKSDYITARLLFHRAQPGEVSEKGGEDGGGKKKKMDVSSIPCDIVQLENQDPTIREGKKRGEGRGGEKKKKKRGCFFPSLNHPGIGQKGRRRDPFSTISSSVWGRGQRKGKEKGKEKETYTSLFSPKTA